MMLKVSQLVGFGARNYATSISFVDSATGGSSSVVLPSGIQAGDLIVLSDVRVGTTTAPTDGTPTGFTEVRSDSVNATTALRQSLYYKIASGSDASATVNSAMSGGGSSKLLAFVFRSNATIAIVTVSGSVGTATTADPAAQTISAASAVVPAVSISVESASSGVTGESYTGSGVDATIIGNGIHMSYKLWSAGSSPANLIADMGDGGTNAISGALFSVRSTA